MFAKSDTVIPRGPRLSARTSLFATLEDETGLLDLILHKSVDERYGELFRAHVLLIAEGTLQREGEAAALLVKRLVPVLQMTDSANLPWGQLETSCRSFR
jgi:DNA polymerase III alpha subunit